MNTSRVVELAVICFLVVAIALCSGCSKKPESGAGGEEGVFYADEASEEAESADATEAEAAEPEAESAATEKTGEVITTDSGLKYIDVEVGDGATPQTGQTVVVHYTGTLADGTKFDSSLDAGRQPFSFPIGMGRVIAGWDEGVGSMKVGGKRKLIIPSELAYGADGRPPVIPPNAELHFDVELLEIR